MRAHARRLAAFRSKNGPASGLAYCGMPCVEFLDVKAWKQELASVYAVELKEEVLSDMRIQWDIGEEVEIEKTRKFRPVVSHVPVDFSAAGNGS